MMRENRSFWDLWVKEGTLRWSCYRRSQISISLPNRGRRLGKLMENWESGYQQRLGSKVSECFRSFVDLASVKITWLGWSCWWRQPTRCRGSGWLGLWEGGVFRGTPRCWASRWSRRLEEKKMRKSVRWSLLHPGYRNYQTLNVCFKESLIYNTQWRTAYRTQTFVFYICIYIRGLLKQPQRFQMSWVTLSRAWLTILVESVV